MYNVTLSTESQRRKAHTLYLYPLSRLSTNYQLPTCMMLGGVGGQSYLFCCFWYRSPEPVCLSTSHLSLCMYKTQPSIIGHLPHVSLPCFTLSRWYWYTQTPHSNSSSQLTFVDEVKVYYTLHITQCYYYISPFSSHSNRCAILGGRNLFNNTHPFGWQKIRKNKSKKLHY